MAPAFPTALSLPFVVGLALAGCQGTELETGSESSAIVGGSTTNEYPAVAHISVQTGETFGACSSTLISPRVLLTAAHCIDSEAGIADGITAYFGTHASGDDPDFIQRIPAVEWTLNGPWSLSGNDIALVLLEHDSDVEPMLFNTQSLSSGNIGLNLHVVGWGNTQVDIGSGYKRHMNTPITNVRSQILNYGNSGANTCQGDSGGPNFVMFNDGTERVAGITSFGTQECLGTSGSTRVDLHTSFIENFIATKDIPQPPELTIVKPGDGDEVPAGFQIILEAEDNTRVDRLDVYVNGELQHEFNVLLPPFIIRTDALPDGVATIEARAYDNRGDMTSKTISVTVDSTCDGPQDCEGGLICGGEGLCVSPDYELGSVCEMNPECQSGICATVAEESLCTSECVPGESNACPKDFRCLRATDELGYCWPDSESGGCSTTGSRSGWGGGAFLLLLGLVWRRRRSCVATPCLAHGAL